jgi:dTDP-4-amino-4,6-dideoxygalactose transaminase
MLSGWFHRLFTRPGTFTYSQFPILWTASWFDANPDVYFWEPIRRLDRFPDDYPERFANVHAALALAGLERLDEWTAKAQAHARMMNDLLGDLTGVQTPFVPVDRRHVYYQYCVYTPSRDEIVKRCIRRGIDLETLHVDICSSLPLFSRFDPSTSLVPSGVEGLRAVPSDVEGRSAAPNAERTAQLIQAPIHSSLKDAEVERVGRTIRDAVLQITREVETHMPAERSA